MNQFPQYNQSLGLSCRTHAATAPAARVSFFHTFWPHVLMLLAFLSAVASAHAQTPPPPVHTDVTFTLTSDIHVAFNGYDDHQGIDASITGNPLDAFLIQNETVDSPTATSSHHDGCVGTTT